jgi:choline monooxygenase
MIAETEMFDPRHYEAVRRPLLDAETMPTWCYTSPAFYRREVERIFHKVWNFLGAADRLAGPGDYFTLDFAGVPLIVLRDRDGELRAFANSCRHRGSMLLEGSGNCRVIVCPYHSWSYHLDGSLGGAPEMQQTHGFDPDRHSLVPLRIDSWGGFLFVNFAADAPPLADYLGDLPEKVGPYRLADMACSRRKEYVMECNWKLFVENAKESYHIATVHR